MQRFNVGFKRSYDMIDLIDRMSLEEKIGQMCVPILQNGVIDQTVKNYIQKYKVGMIRFCPNGEFDNSSVLVGEANPVMTARETAEFTNSLQKLAMENENSIPLFIAVDQEGGTRNDINRNNALVYAGHMCFGAADAVDLTYKVARATAEEFAAMGINLVQAPIVDVFRYAGRRTIKAASFGENPKLVTKHAAAMLRGFKDGGIIAMMKHFPGYGSVSADAHVGNARISKSLEKLEAEDLYPIKKLIRLGIDGIMVGHVVTECVDPEHPATLSKKLLTDYLRKQLGFDNILETDAMRMHAIQDNYGTAEATVMAAEAGNDLILLRGNEEHFKEGYYALLNAVREGRISERNIDESVQRILRIKQRNNLFENAFADASAADGIVGSNEHRKLCRELAERSVAVMKKTHMPVSADKKILVVSPKPQKLDATLDDVQCTDMLLKSVRKMCEKAKLVLISLTPDAKETEKVLQYARSADLIINGTINAILHDNQIELDGRLKALGKPVINVAMESPCDIGVLENVTDYVCMFGCAADWADVAAECIFGKRIASGVVPVNLAHESQIGAVVRTSNGIHIQRRRIVQANVY